MRYGFALFGGTPQPILDEAATEAERLGYDSFWVNSPGRGVNALDALSALSRLTTRLDLGVGVIPFTGRSPEKLIEDFRRLSLPQERMLLGVGSPNPGALKRMREGVAALREGLETRVVAAALGPKMCRLAGEVADGVLLNWLTPEYAKRSAEEIRAGADAAGRETPELYAYVRLALGAAGKERLERESENYNSIPQYAANFARQGVRPAETAILVETAADLPTAVAAWEGAVDEVVFRAVVGNDARDDVLALVRAGGSAID